MKPLGHNNSSVFAYIGLIILLFVPIIGDIAILLCAIFARDSGIKNFARAILVLAILGYVIMFVSGDLPFDSFEFFPENEPVEAFRNIKSFLV